jgi:Fe-S cluster assembly protein SufD
MNALSPAGAQGFLARYDDLRAHLPGEPTTRAAAADSFRARGLPSLRDEAWKYTSLRLISETAFQQPSLIPDPSSLLARLPALDAPRLVLVDGNFRADLSVIPPGITVENFPGVEDSGTQTRPDRDPLVALNTMLAEGGVRITIPAGHDGGLLMLASLATASPGLTTAFHPRHAITLAPGARLALMEISIGEGSYLHNPVTEVTVAEDATLTHIRLQDESPGAFHLSTLYAEIFARGTYENFLLNIGARLSRAEIHARLAGVHGSVHLNAAQLLAGAQHGDFSTIIAHDAPHCASRQTVKHVLTGRSRGVFQGKIAVARGAQKTDGYQMNQALLLSPESEIDCKPQLEIYADDVKCSHGATVGELDPDQIFYARSRGVPESEARAMLIRAFLTEALDTVTNEPARAVLEHAVSAWWERQPA